MYEQAPRQARCNPQSDPYFALPTTGNRRNSTAQLIVDGIRGCRTYLLGP